METYEDEVGFHSPDISFDDARKYIPDVSGRRKIDPAIGLAVLDEVSHLIESVDRSLYEEYEKVARERVLPRDPDDWPRIRIALEVVLPPGRQIGLSCISEVSRTVNLLAPYLFGILSFPRLLV